MTTPHLPELTGVLPGYGRTRGAWAGNSISKSRTGRGVKLPVHLGHRRGGHILWVDPLANTTLVC